MAPIPRPVKRTADEIIEKGICVQEKQVADRCAQCDQPLLLGVWRYQGKKMIKIIRCKTCHTASRFN